MIRQALMRTRYSRRELQGFPLLQDLDSRPSRERPGDREQAQGSGGQSSGRTIEHIHSECDRLALSCVSWNASKLRQVPLLHQRGVTVPHVGNNNQ